MHSPHTLPSPFPTASLSPSSKLTLVPLCCPSDSLVSAWSVQAAPLPSFRQSKMCFFTARLSQGDPGAVTSHGFPGSNSAPENQLWAFSWLWALPVSSCISLPPRCSAGESRRSWPSIGGDVADLLLQGRDWPQVCAQLPGFPQEKGQIRFNILDRAVGTGTLVLARGQEECWKAISTCVPCLGPLCLPCFAFFLSPSPAVLHTVRLATSPAGAGREAGEGMRGETLWEPAATCPSPSLKGTLQNKETQSGNVWVLNVCQK